MEVSHNLRPSTLPKYWTSFMNVPLIKLTIIISSNLCFYQNRNKDETDPKKIEEMIAKGEYVKKEIETLYALKKYRAMKKRYYD